MEYGMEDDLDLLGDVGIGGRVENPETFSNYRKASSNPFQAFLEKREKMKQEQKTAPINTPFYSTLSKESEFKQTTFKASNPIDSRDDSFITDSETFLEEMQDLEKLTLDYNTVLKRKSTVSKLNDDLKKKTYSTQSSMVATGREDVNPIANTKPQQQVQTNRSLGMPMSQKTTSSHQQYPHFLDYEEEEEMIVVENQMEPQPATFKQRVEDRIRQRNDSHRMWQKKQTTEDTHHSKNFFQPDDLRKIISSVSSKKKNPATTKQPTQKAFSLASLMDEVKQLDKENEMSANTKKPLYSSSIDFKKLNKTSDDNKLKSREGVSLEPRPASAKKVRFNPNKPQTETRSKSLSKKEPTRNQLVTPKEVKKTATLSGSVAFGTKKPAFQPPRPSTSQSSTSIRELLAQKKAAQEQVATKKTTQNTSTKTPTKIPSKQVAKPQQPSLNNPNVSAIKKFQPEVVTFSLKESLNMGNLSLKKAPDSSIPAEKHHFLEKTTEASDGEDDFFEARRLMQRISLLRNFIGGSSSKPTTEKASD